MGFLSKTKDVLIAGIPLYVGVGVYFAVRNNKKLNGGQIAGIVAGSTLLTFLGQRTIKSYKGNIGKARVDYGQIPTVFNSAGQPVLWDADPLAKEIFANFEGYNAFWYPATAGKIVKLNDDQVKLLYNHYNEYYAKEFDTLAQLIAAEWRGYGEGGWYDKASQRMSKLGLHENAPVINLDMLNAQVANNRLQQIESLCCSR